MRTDPFLAAHVLKNALKLGGVEAGVHCDTQQRLITVSLAPEQAVALQKLLQEVRGR